MDPVNAKVIIVSMSHQSIASIAAKYNLTFQLAAEYLASFFEYLGVEYIFDITFAWHLSLIESIKEFIENKKHNREPLLSSICPGFVCYVEKTHGDRLIPFLSKVKSPQQIMGSLIKSVWAKSKGIESEIYHITVMPCYDKKLEASRDEFKNQAKEPEVDCVITPIELETMLEQEGVVLSLLNPRKLDIIDSCFSTSNSIESYFGSGSGGYTENIFRYACSNLFDQNLNLSQTNDLNYEVKRNRDFMELNLDDKTTGQRLLSFAVINGFRNIQTMIQRIKRKTFKYDYVEVMACPSGCLNGGGMLRGSSLEDKFFDQVESIYKSLDISQRSLDPDNPLTQERYNHWFKDDEQIQKMLYTQFKAVPKMTNLLSVNW